MLYSEDAINQIKADSLLLPFKKYYDNVESTSPLKKMLYIDTKTWLPDRLLIKADKMTMANSLELRVPLLDHKLLEFAASLPDNKKIYCFKTKYIFKKILTNRIPKEIIRRKKAGFPIPYAEWLKHYKSDIIDILTDSKTSSRGYFDKRAIKKLIFDHWMRNGKYSMEIFNLLTLEIWHRVFIDSNNLYDH